MAPQTFLVTQGTATQLANDLVGTTVYPISKIDYGVAGASTLFTGTLLELTNQTKGTITALQTGTITAGTVDSISQLPPNSWGTTVNTTSNSLGTIKAGVGGSQIFVTDLIISVGSASNVTVGNGAAANNIAGTFYLALNGGLTSNFRVPIATSAGSSLVYQQTTSSGPLSITAYGFVR